MSEPSVQGERKKRINRLQFVYLMVFLLFASIILRLVQLQIQQGGKYTSELMARSLKKDAILAMRGNIYDRSGHVIAQSRPAFLAVFREEDTMSEQDYVQLVEKLENILTNVDRATLLKKWMSVTL